MNKVPYQILGIFCAACWGLIFPLAKLQVGTNPPLLSLALRFLISALVWAPLLKKPSEKFGKIILFTALYMLIPFIGFTIALRHVDSNLCSLVNQLNTPILSLIGVLLFGEKIGPRLIVGSLLALMGVYFVIQAPRINSVGWHSAFLLSAAVISFCAGAAYLRILKLDGLQAILWANIILIPVMWVLSTIFEPNSLHHLSTAPFSFYALCIVIGLLSIGSNIVYGQMIQAHGLSKTSYYSLLSPVFNVFFAYLILGEALSVQVAIGAVAVIFGVYMAQSKDEINEAALPDAQAHFEQI